MKKVLFLLTLAFLAAGLFAQSDDDLFSSDDDFFFDEGVAEISESSVTTSSELNHGNLFENGSVKVGGKISSSLSTLTTLYADDSLSFGDHLKDTTLVPDLSAELFVDARPTQVLRLYTKFAFAYPFKDYGVGIGTITISNWFKMKELFTDFSLGDNVNFRFGLHTVSWGAGYYFSPVSDIINSSSIDPENPDLTVDGSLNLRTQITFKDSQNCLWFYLIAPSLDFSSSFELPKLKDTALALKSDLVWGNWEFGLGGYYKLDSAPKALITATGGFKKINLFAEAVYSYGAASEWESSTDWSGKSHIFQGTLGCSYFWKTPSITLLAQYYYDGNDKDLKSKYLTSGHNLVVGTNFGRIFGSTDFTATIFGMMNIGKSELDDTAKAQLQAQNISSAYFSSLTLSAIMNYSPNKNMTFGLGPYITMEDFDSKPNVSLKFTASLGGGKF